MAEPVSYLLCSAPRSGNSCLCEALRATGVAGVPREYFMPAFPGSEALDVGVAGFDASAWAAERGITNFPEFFAAIRKEARTANGVFGASLQWGSFEAVLDKIRTFTPYGGTATIRQLLRKSFGSLRFVHLVRHDRVRQAVSWALAHQTGRYTSTQAEACSPSAEPDFDAALLDCLIARIEEAEAGFESLFDLLEVEPLRLVYEDWSDDIPATVNRLLEWLELDDEPATLEASGLARSAQRTALNDEWVSRYLALRDL